MDKTIRQVLIMFLLIILLDCVEFQLDLKKQRWGIFSSIVNVVSYAKKTVNLIK